MASEQQQRRVRDENFSELRDVCVEKDLFPNLASHFESLAEKVRDSEVVVAKEVPTGEDKSKVSITLAGKHGVREERHHQMGTQMESKSKDEVDGVSKNIASQEGGAGGAGNVGKTGTVGAEAESALVYGGSVMEKGREGYEYAKEKLTGAGQAEYTKGTAGQAGDVLTRSTQAVPEYGRAAVEKSQQGLEYAKGKM